MLKYLSNPATNLYDLMAMIFKKIDALPVADKETIYQRFQSNYPYFEQTVESAISFFNKKEQSLYYDSVDIDQLIVLSSYVEEEDAYDCFLLLAYLDQNIRFEISIKRFLNTCFSWQKGIYSFNALNNNGVGILLPRFTPAWSRINNVTRGACNAKPFSLIKKYIWCVDCGSIEVNHIYADINPLDKDDVEEPFRIVCSPLVDKLPYEYELGRENDINYFYINNYPQDVQNIVISRIKETLYYARDVHASIVLFPEMMLDPINRDQILQIIKDDWESPYPKVVYFPSSEYKEGDEWKNQIIVANESGDILYEYNKQLRYQHKVKNDDGSVRGIFFEPIASDKKFTVLHLNKIGRIGILICADIFDDTIKAELWTKYDLDLVLVAAYTSGWDFFERCANGMSDSYCEVIVCNTCAAIENEKRDIVYPVAYYPLGHNSKNPHMKKKCENNCNGCAFCVEIPRSYYDKFNDPLTHEKFDGGR